MKWDQVDTALEFLRSGISPVVLQCEYLIDARMIKDYVLRNIEIPPDYCDHVYSMYWNRYGNVVILPLFREAIVHRGYHMENLFLIERQGDDYVEGDILKERTQSGKPMSITTSKTSAVIKPKSDGYLAVHLETNIVSDPSTLVLLYDDPSLESKIKSIVRSYKNKNAESFLDQFTTIDVFVEINAPYDGAVPWKRIAYECTKGNPNPGHRFGGALFVKVSRTFTKPTTTLNMLLEGVE